MSKIKSLRKLNYGAKEKAFPYQIEAFLTLKDLDYSAIFHEQGLGKTKIAIDLLLYWLQNRDIDTVMIVTKKQLVKNWVDEFKIHTHIVPKILSSDKSSNFYVYNSPAKVVVTNFETLSTDKSRMELFLKTRDVAIIIDESTKLKNPDAKLTRDFFDLAQLFKIKTIMTGTPVANRPYDIWAQVFFLDKGQSLGTDFNDFKKRTDLSNKLSKDEKAREQFEETVSDIYTKIADFSVRETKASCAIQLPQKVFESIFVDFEDNQLKIYQDIMNELQVEVEQKGRVVLDDDSASLKRLLRLLQVASNPKLIDDGYKGPSAKEEKLDVLIKDICSVGDKCIVWTNFIDNVDAFCMRYEKYGACKIHGGMAISDRNSSVDSFKNNDECKVLFATPQSAKEGLTLTVANHVIFYDRGFNLDDYLQAQDRIHRISQKKTCYIHNIMINNSIDEWIDTLIEAKRYAALLAQGDIPIEEYEEYADYGYGEMIQEILEAGEK